MASDVFTCSQLPSVELKHWRLPHDAIFFVKPYFCSGHFISLSRSEMLHHSQPSYFFVLILFFAKDGGINYQPATLFPFNSPDSVNSSQETISPHHLLPLLASQLFYFSLVQFFREWLLQQ